MKIKTVRAHSFREALARVKKELGSDAVILSSQDKNEENPYVEVTAGIDYDMEGGKCEYSLEEGVNQKERSITPEEQPSEERGSPGFLMLREEIISLKKAIETMKERGFALNLPEASKEIYCLLCEKAIKDEFAMHLVERAGELDALRAVMKDDLSRSWSSTGGMSRRKDLIFSDDRRIKMLMGPTGAGKTTTVAKLASLAIRDGKKVALISVDTYKIGAAEQIRIYSRMLGIPLDIVSDGDDFIKSVSRFSDRDVILVDTTGHNPRDIENMHNIKRIHDSGIPLETHLLLSASSDSDFLMDSHNYYHKMPIDAVAFTKTDEAVRLGSLYNLCRIYQKPVAYITTGQNVPGNIEFVDSNTLTNMILRTGSA